MTVHVRISRAATALASSIPTPVVRRMRRTLLLSTALAVLGACPAFAIDVSNETELRGAIETARTNPGTEIVLTGNISLTQDLPALQGSGTVIRSDAGQQYAIDGGGAYRGLLVYSGNTRVQDLTIQNAVAQGGKGGDATGTGGGGGAGLGGALFVNAGATVTASGHVVLNGNSAVGGAGGSVTAGTGSVGAGGGMGGDAGDAAIPSGGSGGGGIGRGATGGDNFGATAGGSGIVTGGASGGGGSGAGAGAGGTDGGGGGGSAAGGGGGGVGGGGFSGSGGFGGGGGSFDGAGGFGGGGGGPGAAGGFGGGGSGAGTGFGGPGGFGGGDGANAGGGGAGMGGAIFVVEGGGLIVEGTLDVINGSVAGGAGGTGGAGDSTTGSAYGSGIFLQGSGNLVLAPGAGLTQTINDGIADQTGSGGSGAYASGGSSCSPGAGCAGYSGSGSWGITKDGAGTLVLAGASTYTGATSVDAGTLIVDGTIVSATTVNSGALLGGIGTLGATEIASGGVHAPGNSIGTQTVSGPYANHGTLQIEATPSAADQIVVNGTVDITGATLDLVLSPATAASWSPLNGPFTIIDNDGADAVTGTFASVTKNLVFLDETLDYAGGTGNDVTLALARNDTDFTDVGETRNQKATAAGIESLGAGNALWNIIALSSDADVARASFDQLSGEVHASTASALIEESRRVRDAINDRLRAAFGEVGATALPVMAYAPGGPVLAPATTERFAVWGQGFGSWGSFDGDGNAAGLDADTGGLLLGGDGQVGDWRLGMLAGYSRTSIDIDDRHSSAESDNVHLGVYGGRTFGALAVRTGLAYSWHAIDSERSVAIPGLLDDLDADYDAATAQAFGEFGYRFDTSLVSFEPFANLAYVHFDSDGFTEDGGVAALSAGDATTETAFTTIGLRAETGIAFGNLTAAVHGTLGWRHAFGDITPLAELAFAGGSVFTIAGVPIAEDAAIVAAGLDFAVSDTATFGIAYDGQFGDGVTQQSVQATFTARF